MSDHQPSLHGSLVPPRGWLDDDADQAAGVGAGFLLLITVVALALRLVGLDAMSLWVDEVFTWELIAPGADADFPTRILAAYQGPLYHAAAWPLVRLAETGFMLRLPAAVAGAFTVPLLGIFAGRLWGREAGRLAALLACVSPFLIWYSQEARGYSFVMFFATASGLVLMDAMRHGIGGGRALGLMLLIAAGLLSNFIFVFLVLAFGVTVLLAARPRTLRQWLLWGLAFGGALVLALPWLLEAAGIWEVGRVMPGAETGQALRGDTTFSPWALPFTGFALFYGFSLGPSLAQLHGPDRLGLLAEHAALFGVATAAVVVPLLVSLLQLSRRRWALLLWIAIPLLGVVVLALRNVKPFNVRYAATIWPWAILLVTAGLMRLALWPRRVFTTALLVLCLGSLVGLHVMPRYAKADIRGAAAVINRAGGDAGFVLAPTVGPVVRRYLPAATVKGCWDEAVLGRRAAADEADRPPARRASVGLVPPCQGLGPRPSRRTAGGARTHRPTGAGLRGRQRHGRPLDPRGSGPGGRAVSVGNFYDDRGGYDAFIGGVAEGYDRPDSLAYRATKRMLDLGGALVGLLLVVPLLPFIAAMIKLETSGPIMFKQVRVGQRGRQFYCYKFRSMSIDAEARKAELDHLNEASGAAFKIKDDPRITRVGRFLRRSSLDEFPQLWNVLLGEMSIVGPRPQIPGEVAEYTAEQARRLVAKPGLTCLWQVSGRSQLDFGEWMALDQEYVRRRSLGFDLAILLRTLPAVVDRKGAY